MLTKRQKKIVQRTLGGILSAALILTSAGFSSLMKSGTAKAKDAPAVLLKDWTGSRTNQLYSDAVGATLKSDGLKNNMAIANGFLLNINDSDLYGAATQYQKTSGSWEGTGYHVFHNNAMDAEVGYSAIPSSLYVPENIICYGGLGNEAGASTFQMILNQGYLCEQAKTKKTSAAYSIIYEYRETASATWKRKVYTTGKIPETKIYTEDYDSPLGIIQGCWEKGTGSINKESIVRLKTGDSPCDFSCNNKEASSIRVRIMDAKIIRLDANGGKTGNYVLNGFYNSYDTDTVWVDGIASKEPTRDGYTFGGWYTAKTGGVKVEDSTTSIPGSCTTLYARWIPISYTISYDLDGGIMDQNNPDSYTTETEDFTLHQPVKTGYLFTGWTGSNGETPEEIITIQKGTTGNQTYKAHWTPVRYQISFDANGGSGMMPEQEMFYEETKSLNANGYTYADHIFIGWNTRADGTGTPYAEGQSVCNLSNENNAVIILYAQWQNNSGSGSNPLEPTSPPPKGEEIGGDDSTDKGNQVSSSPKPTAYVDLGNGKENKNTSGPGASIDAGNEVQMDEQFKQGKITYRLTGNKTVEVVKAGKNITKITLNTATYNGKKYQVATVGKAAFKNCKKLKTVTLGKNVKKIKANAFYGCSKLTRFKISSEDIKFGAHALKKVKPSCKYQVPSGKRKKLEKNIKKAGK
ncbi:MAG: InlB B-repeat-containing protein [Lachnospiraceae bacterium]|nr:InlB B-repeat-containing protein [Lachnospiraceae bacterium]MBP3458904.1 InlB B-repeat-containing protein [Lachnospiraceae bacterium]